MFVRCLVDFVVPFGLEKEVSSLPACHGHQPGEQGSHGRILEQQQIRTQEAHCTDQVQALVDAAVMVVTMVVPALRLQGLQVALDHALSL